MQFASDLDEATKKRVDRGALLTEILKQRDREPVSFEQAVVVLYSALNGYVDDIPLEKAKQFETHLVDYLEKRYRAEILDEIQKTGDLSERVEARLKEVIGEAKGIF